MVKVEGVSQQWCDQFGAVVLAKMKSFYGNHTELSLDNFPDDNPVYDCDDKVCCYLPYKGNCVVFLRDNEAVVALTSFLAMKCWRVYMPVVTMACEDFLPSKVCWWVVMYRYQFLSIDLLCMLPSPLAKNG